MSEEKKWKPGDVVRLKSGGPKMTVEQYDNTGNYPLWGVRCVWFSGVYHVQNVCLMRECFHEDDLMLEPADEEES